MIAVLGQEFCLKGLSKSSRKEPAPPVKPEKQREKMKRTASALIEALPMDTLAGTNLRSKSGTGITYGGGSIDGRTESRGLTGISIHRHL